MLNSDLDLSQLRTTTSFDRGMNSTMAVGIQSSEVFTPSSLLIESLIERLCKIVDKNPETQRKLYLKVCKKLHQMHLVGASYDMDEFQFMRSHYNKALYNFLVVTHNTSNEEFSPSPNRSSINFHADIFDVSRYSTEFVELDFIAKGGFGNVFKVQHKLDGGIYAVKKIFLRYESHRFLRTLNEVKMLARFYHPNIVAYKAAWLEHMSCNQVLPIKEITYTTNNIGTSGSLSTNLVPSSSSNSLEIVFEGSSSNDNSSKESKLHNSELLSGKFCVNGRFGKVVSSSSKEILTSEDSNGFKNKSPIGSVHGDEIALRNEINKSNSFQSQGFGICEWAVLYIQMQLCHATLRNWLDDRNQSNQPVNPNLCLSLLKQVTSGLEYIHSQKIVHHDIKPSNIFVSEDLRNVQLGDFGLACHLLSHSSPDPVIELLPHTSGKIGTELYAAPEQLKGMCHPKSDIYSLGIVFFELVHPFQTSMERSKLIGQLKKGYIPSTTDSNYPHLAKIIKKTVNANYKKRPSSTELVESISISETEGMQLKLKEQEMTISLLRKENKEKDEMISDLQRQLKLLMSMNNS